MKNTKHELYETWRGMRQRCSNKNHHAYKYYGAVGVRVCERWEKSFAAFIEDMGPRPDGHTLDRRESWGNYEPSNCRWLTREQQQNNMRKRREIAVHCPMDFDYPGITATILVIDSLAGWSRRTGLDRRCISKRLKRGWSNERAVGVAC